MASVPTFVTYKQNNTSSGVAVSKNKKCLFQGISGV